MKPTQAHRPPAKSLLHHLILILAVTVVLQPNGLGAREPAHGDLHARLLHGVDRPKQAYVAGEILVRFKTGTPEHRKQLVHSESGARTMGHFTSVERLERVRLPAGLAVEDAVAQYRSKPEVQYAEPNFIVSAFVNPNDPQFSQQWSLHNTGQSGGTPGADIGAPAAWDLTVGSSAVVVGVLDTGMDYTHPDLASQVWHAPNPFTASRYLGNPINCSAGSVGFNAIDLNCDPNDDHGHGTHVSGILGAAGNNGTGMAGVNWAVQILPCKMLNQFGFGDVASAIGCLDLLKALKDAGINIVASNNSWGGLAYSQALADAISGQLQSGILFVASAGNEFSDNDLTPVYPASYMLPNVISVAASTRRDEFPTFSNRGRRTVHLAAPGAEILSTTPNGTYSQFSGTSMAAPHVTGVAALLKAQDSLRDWRASKNLLLASGDAVSALGETITGKRLHAGRALGCSNQLVQSRVLPVPDIVSSVVGQPVTISGLSIDCAQAAGPVEVTVSPGGQTLVLADDGSGLDLAAGDGIFTGQWTPAALGSYTLAFPWGDSIQVQVLEEYAFQLEPFHYTIIGGTNLNLGDDSIVQVASPFPIQYGGGRFTQFYVGSNGTVSFTDAFSDYIVSALPTTQAPPFAIPQPITLVAPWWQDLFAIRGTAQNVFWEVVGSAPDRQLVVEWRDVRSFRCNSDAAATIRFQIVFFEGRSDLRFNYSDATFGGRCAPQDHGGAATVGLQEARDTAQMFSFRGQAINDGTSILWTIPTAPPPPNPVPTLSSISPSTVDATGPAFTLTVIGSNFSPASRIRFNNQDRVTTFVSSTELQAQIEQADINPLFPAPAQISVFTPEPGGGISQPLTLSLTSPVPAITSLSPSSVPAGDMSVVLTVQGSGLRSNFSNVRWNGSHVLFTVRIDSSTLKAVIPYTLLGTPGTAQITVVNDPPGGGTSNALPFTVTPPQEPGTPTAQPSFVAQVVEVHADGGVTGPPGMHIPPPIRFAGWNHARKMGPAYFRHFTRPPGGVPITESGAAAKQQTASASRPLEATATAFSAGSLPGFDFRQALPAGFIPTSVATGDFNGDSHLDWVVSNGGSDTLWIYLGRGDGTTHIPTILPVAGVSPTQVVTADLRGNGTLDLVVAEVDSGTIGVLLGNGDGTFQPEVRYSIPAPPLTVAAADFNGDGNVDVAAGLLGDSITGPLVFLVGDGSGRLGSPVARPLQNGFGFFLPFSLQVADFSNDGLPDLVVTDLGGMDGVHAYVSVGDGTFKHSQVVTRNSPFFQILNAAPGDMDEDGCIDIVSSSTAGIVYLFRGYCDGSFDGFPSVFQVGAGDAGAGLALADVNGDGHLDMVSSGIQLQVSVFGPDTGNTVAVLLGDGQGRLAPGRIYRGETGMFSLGLADLNEDGFPDVITANQDSDSTSVYLNNQQGGFGHPTGGYVGYATDGLTGGPINAPFRGPLVVDIDGDGHLDIGFLEFALFDPRMWQWTVLRNDGTGHFERPVRSDALDSSLQLYDLQLLDVRGTGLPDLVVIGADLNQSTTYLAFAPNIGGGKFGPLNTVNIGGRVSGLLQGGDFNGDGKLDLAFARSSGRSDLIARITMLFGNGNGTFQPGPNTDFAAAPGAGGEPRMVFAGDFNRDGNLDLIVGILDNVVGSGSPPNPVFQLLGRGDGTFNAATTLLPESSSLGMADLNHDGLQDLVELTFPFTSTGFGLAQYRVLVGQPDGRFLPGAVYQPFAGNFLPSRSPDTSVFRAQSPMLADVNGDGELDIVVPQAVFQQNQITGAPASSYLQVLLGNGDATFTPNYAVFRLSKVAAPNLAADVNGDGRADLIEVDPWPSSYNVVLASAGPALRARVVSSPVIGSHGTLRLSLSLVAASPTIVMLSASDPNIAVPSSVTIPTGNITHDVPFSIGPGFDPSRAFEFHAQLGTHTAVAHATQAAPGQPFGFKLFAGGQHTVPPGAATPDYGPGVRSVNGYATSVRFECRNLPPGASCVFTQNPVDLAPGGFVSTGLQVQVGSSTPLGIYGFTISATDGFFTDEALATVAVADFTVSISPSSQTSAPGRFVFYTLNVTPLFGWMQGLFTSCTVTPPGPQCSLSGSFVGTGQSSFSLNTQSVPAGDYNFTVTASGSGVSRSASASLRVSDFSVAPPPTTSAMIPVGGSAQFNFTLNSQFSFTDQVTFSCSTPTGVSCAFNPNPVSLPANGSASTQLTVSVTSRPTGQAPSGPPSFSTPAAPLAAWMLAALLLLMAWRVAPRVPRLPAAARAVCILLLILTVSGGIASCGGGGGGSVSPPPPPPPPPPATPPVTVSIQVQASSPSISTRTVATITITVP